MAKIRKMFTGGNTSQGFYSLHNNIISEDRNKLYILKGMPGGGKSSMMRDIGMIMVDEGYDIEFHHCPSDPRSMDAVVIPELGIAIIDGTAPHVIDPVYPGLTDEIIDLATNIDKNELRKNKDEIIAAKNNNRAAYRKAFNYFHAAGWIYREIEEANRLFVDEISVNREMTSLIEKIFSGKEIEIKSNGFIERHLFSTANTPEDYVDYTSTLLEVNLVFYISSEIGIDVSRYMRLIGERARFMNYDIEIYHSSMMPDNIETIYIKNLDTIITSNRSGEDVKHTLVDLNKYMDLERIDQEDYKIYELLYRKGIESLGEAKKNHFILENEYKSSIDYSGVNIVKK